MAGVGHLSSWSWTVSLNGSYSPGLTRTWVGKWEEMCAGLRGCAVGVAHVAGRVLSYRTYSSLSDLRAWCQLAAWGLPCPLQSVVLDASP